MRLVLCRHGETDFNVQRRLQGSLETELNARGRKQAKLLAKKLENDGFYRAFCSTQKRCRDTLAEILKHHSGLKTEYRKELAEINLGKYTGMNHAEIEEKFPGDWAKRVDSKYDFKHDGGESYKEVDEKRVKPLLREFAEKYSSRRILVVTHQGTGRLIIGRLLGLGEEEKMRIVFPNDCIYYLDYLPHETRLGYYRAETGERGLGYFSAER